MRLGADSWLFFKVAEKDDAAMRLLKEVERGKHRLIVSVKNEKGAIYGRSSNQTKSGITSLVG